MFTQAELAVLLSEARGLPPAIARSALQGANFSSQELKAARENLMKLGIFERGSFGRIVLNKNIERLLLTAFAPERVLILRMEPRGLPARQIIYSLRDGKWVCNTIDAKGYHIFTMIGEHDKLAQETMSVTGLASPSGRPVPPEVEPLAALLNRAMGVYLVLRGPNAQASPAAALSWITTGDGVWFVDPAGPPETARRISIAELRQRAEALAVA